VNKRSFLLKSLILLLAFSLLAIMTSSIEGAIVDKKTEKPFKSKKVSAKKPDYSEISRSNKPPANKDRKLKNKRNLTSIELKLFTEDKSRVKKPLSGAYVELLKKKKIKGKKMFCRCFNEKRKTINGKTDENGFLKFNDIEREGEYILRFCFKKRYNDRECNEICRKSGIIKLKKRGTTKIRYVYKKEKNTCLRGRISINGKPPKHYVLKRIFSKSNGLQKFLDKYILRWDNEGYVEIFLMGKKGTPTMWISNTLLSRDGNYEICDLREGEYKLIIYRYIHILRKNAIGKEKKFIVHVEKGKIKEMNIDLPYD